MYRYFMYLYIQGILLWVWDFMYISFFAQNWLKNIEQFMSTEQHPLITAYSQLHFLSGLAFRERDMFEKWLGGRQGLPADDFVSSLLTK